MGKTARHVPTKSKHRHSSLRATIVIILTVFTGGQKQIPHTTDALHDCTVITACCGTRECEDELRRRPRRRTPQKRPETSAQDGCCRGYSTVVELHCYRSGANIYSLSTRGAAQLYPKTTSRTIRTNIKHNEKYILRCPSSGTLARMAAWCPCRKEIQ